MASSIDTGKCLKTGMLCTYQDCIEVVKNEVEIQAALWCKESLELCGDTCSVEFFHLLKCGCHIITVVRDIQSHENFLQLSVNCVGGTTVVFKEDIGLDIIDMIVSVKEESIYILQYTRDCHLELCQYRVELEKGKLTLKDVVYIPMLNMCNERKCINFSIHNQNLKSFSTANTNSSKALYILYGWHVIEYDTDLSSCKNICLSVWLPSIPPHLQDRSDLNLVLSLVDTMKITDACWSALHGTLVFVTNDFIIYGYSAANGCFVLSQMAPGHEQDCISIQTVWQKDKEFFLVVLMDGDDAYYLFTWKGQDALILHHHWTVRDIYTTADFEISLVVSSFLLPSSGWCFSLVRYRCQPENIPLDGENVDDNRDEDRADGLERQWHQVVICFNLFHIDNQIIIFKVPNVKGRFLDMTFSNRSRELLLLNSESSLVGCKMPLKDFTLFQLAARTVLQYLSEEKILRADMPRSLKVYLQKCLQKPY